jgi:hypothetical protein
MWQVSGRFTASIETYARLDLYYVDNWSLVTDVAIMLRRSRPCSSATAPSDRSTNLPAPLPATQHRPNWDRWLSRGRRELQPSAPHANRCRLGLVVGRQDPGDQGGDLGHLDSAMPWVVTDGVPIRTPDVTNGNGDRRARCSC